MFRITTLNCPSLCPEQIEKLQDAGIHNVIDLAFQDKQKVIEAGNLTEVEYEVLKMNFLEITAPDQCSGSSAVSKEGVTRPHIPTGIYQLDKFLQGGIAGGEILEIYGESGTGKTQFCQALCAQFFHKMKYSVAYFDLTRDFSAKRMMDFCKGPVSPQDLKKVRIVRPTTSSKLIDEIKKLRLSVIERADTPDSDFYANLKLVIVDSVPMTMYPALDDENMSWRFYEEEFIDRLAQLSFVNDGIVVVLVNHAIKIRHKQDSISTGGADGERRLNLIKPALGMFWTHKVNLRLRLSKNPKRPDTFPALLEKANRKQLKENTPEMTPICKFNFVIAKDKFKTEP